MLTIDQQASRWVVRQAEHGLDKPERAAFEAWCAQDVRHAGAYARALALQRRLERLKDGPSSPAADEQAEQAAPAAANWPGLARFGALAAGLVLAVALGMSMVSGPSASVVYATQVGEFRRIPLADQSIAHINSASRVDVSLTDSARHVTVAAGEAWFDVAKDKSRPFVVEAGLVRLRAVGTSFSVRRGASMAEVLVTEGVVEVWKSGSEASKLILTAGEAAAVPEGAGAVKIVRRPDEVLRKLAWREGKVVFTNQSLGEAVAEFNRYSQKRIVVADSQLARRTLIGRFRVDDPEGFTQHISTLFNVPIAVTHDAIIIGDVRLLDGRSKTGNNPT